MYFVTIVNMLSTIKIKKWWIPRATENIMSVHTKHIGEDSKIFS